jgi:predicted nucleotidyltransferase
MFEISDMRFHEGLDDLLGNPVRLRILRALTRFPGQGFTGRELARQSSASPSQAISALKALQTTGIVYREIAGPSHIWRLAEEHILTPLLRDLFRGEAGSLASLRGDLAELLKGFPIQRAVLFGSIARGEERPTSDVDLFVQVASRFDKTAVEDGLSAASSRFALRFGNPLSLLVLEEERVRVPPKPVLVKKVLEEGIEVRT